MVLLHRPDADLIRHGPAMPDVAGPDDSRLEEHSGGQQQSTPPSYDNRGGADDVNPPELVTWYRYPDAPADPVIGQALVAFATNFPSIGVGLQPHAGFTIGQSHLEMSTGVIGHTLTFHEPIQANDWMLFHLSSPYAGRGRIYGMGDVYNRTGDLLASFTQDAMARGMAERSGGTAGKL
jgi:acyl-CoA thioesterase II